MPARFSVEARVSARPSWARKRLSLWTAVKQVRSRVITGHNLSMSQISVYYREQMHVQQNALYILVCACVRVCVCACVRACARARARATDYENFREYMDR